MDRFRNILSDCELAEIHMQIRRFTWSNERQTPTLVKLNRVFCNQEWEFTFGCHVLQALSTSPLGHCPLLLSSGSGPTRLRSFKLKNFGIKMPGFNEVVQKSWNEYCEHVEPCHFMFGRLQRTA